MPVARIAARLLPTKVVLTVPSASGLVMQSETTSKSGSSVKMIIVKDRTNSMTARMATSKGRYRDNARPIEGVPFRRDLAHDRMAGPSFLEKYGHARLSFREDRPDVPLHKGCFRINSTTGRRGSQSFSEVEAQVEGCEAEVDHSKEQ